MEACTERAREDRHDGSSQHDWKRWERPPVPARRLRCMTSSREFLDYVITNPTVGGGRAHRHRHRTHPILSFADMSLARAAGAVVRPSQRASTSLLQRRAASSHAHDEHHDGHHEEYHDTNVYEPEGASPRVRPSTAVMRAEHTRRRA